MSNVQVDTYGEIMTVTDSNVVSSYVVTPTVDAYGDESVDIAPPTVGAPSFDFYDYDDYGGVNDGASFTIDPYNPTTPVVINGGAGNDTITAANSVVTVGESMPVTLVPGDQGALTINGGNGNDTLVVDSSTAPFAIPITFNGGSGSNTLSLTGGTALGDVYSPGAATGAGADLTTFAPPGTGTQDTVQSVTFTNMSSFTDAVSSPVTVNGSSGNDTITYAQGSQYVQSADLTDASEVGSTVTITTTTATNYQVGQSVVIANVGAGYDGTWTITAVNDSTGFTYTSDQSGLSEVSGPDISSATATVSLGTGSVAVNNLVPLDFFNKSQLTIDTGTGDDKVLADLPYDAPYGLTSNVEVNFGDPSGNNSLVYTAVPDTELVVFPYAQGIGGVYTNSSDDPTNVEFTGDATLSIVGTPGANALDLEQPEVSAGATYTVTPSVTPGAGTITGEFDITLGFAVVSSQLKASSFASNSDIIPSGPFTETINYSGFTPVAYGLTNAQTLSPKISQADAPLNFGAIDGTYFATVTYNAIPGKGNYIDISAGEITDTVPNYAYPAQELVVYSYEDTGLQVNAGAGNYVEYDESANNLYTNVYGASASSQDSFEFHGDGSGNVTVDADSQAIYESGEGEVYFAGMSNVYVDGGNKGVNFDGNGGATSVTVTPTGANAATVSLDAALPKYFISN